MAEGWRQIFRDLSGALGLGKAMLRFPSVGTRPRPADAAVPGGSGKAMGLERKDAGPSPAVRTDTPETAIPSGHETEEPEAGPPAGARKLLSFTGLAIALAIAIGLGWYVYFGGPKPPAPDVVATYEGGEITVKEVREHLATLSSARHITFQPTYESYRELIKHMLLNDLVRRWAAEQKMDADARFKDAMRHISESVTFDEWVARLHESEMLSAVGESDIQAYYEANRETFASATLAEVREQIRQTLAHQGQEKFFEDYIGRLRAQATIATEYDLLLAPPPTDTQVKDYFRINNDKFAVAQSALVDVLFVAFEGTGEEDENQARARAEQARAALQAGKAFVDVAGQYSQEPYSPQGTTIEAGKAEPELVEPAFALSREGDLSPVILGQNGFYVLMLRERRPERTMSFEEARPQVAAAVRADNERVWFEQNEDRTLFTIHGDRFTLGDFYHEYQNLPPELQAQFAGSDGLKELADLLVDRMLVLEDAYNMLADRENAPLLEEARTAVLRQMLHETEVDSRVTVSDQDVRDYYEDQKEHLALPPEARIQSIRFARGLTDDERKLAWKKADEAYRKLVPGFSGKPADFEEVAYEYDEAEINPTGDELGDWIRMGDDPILDLLAHPLHEYVFALPVGGVSQPFEYGSNIYIVRILERTEPKPLEFEDIKDVIRAELEARQHEELDAEVAARLVSEAGVTIYDRVILKAMETDNVTPVP